MSAGPEVGPGPLTVVVGSGGLLGRRLVASLRRTRADVVTPAVDWNDPESAPTALAAAAAEAGASGREWRLAWCAGAGVVGTPAEAFEAEVEVFASVLSALSSLSSGPPSVVFLASSAGGLYAGSPDQPPFDEASAVRPLAPYGHAKVAMENLLVDWAREQGSRAVLGRIANLYGPGQNLAKPQGVVSQLCRCQLTREPLGVYVSLDTLRDYLYIDDAAEMVRACLAMGAALPPGTSFVKVLASGRAVSLGAIIGEATRVFRRHPRISTRASAASAAQVRDLRLTSRVWPEVAALAVTPLPVGLRATGDSIASLTRVGRLP